MKELQVVLDQTLVDASQQINENYKQKIHLKKMKTQVSEQSNNNTLLPKEQDLTEPPGNETLIGFQNVRISKNDYTQLIRSGNLSRQ